MHASVDSRVVPPEGRGAENDAAASAIARRYLLRPTAKQRMLMHVLRAPDSRFQPICQYLTLDECAAAQVAKGQGTISPTERRRPCEAVHFAPILYPQTDLSVGHCSYLNTCHRTNKCKYLHFKPVRHPDAAPFVWQSLYDDPMPVREALPPSASRTTTASDGNVYGHPQTTPQAAERQFVEALIRHPTRALYAHNLPQWTRPGPACSSSSSSIDDDSSLVPAQWVDVNLKDFDYAVLGKFDVIVADPPWDIHMSLPYGTMSDDDMRAMPFPQLQDEGFLFLWVTGRAMELGRELLAVWGYTRVDEIVWVKVGQTQRLVRTGRTGHWLNHTKEHCLVGVKAVSQRPPVTPLSSLSHTYAASHAPGLPQSILLPSWANAGLDTDVIVAEVRDTSRKPDELYAIIERLCPRGRKVELFGRRHNARPGWITVGNQLKGDHIVDPALRERLERWRASQQSQRRD